MGRKLETAAWRPFLDRVSKGIAGKQAESLNLGDEIEAELLIGLG